MALPESTIARARLRWFRAEVEVDVDDEGQWMVPEEEPRLLEHLKHFYSITPFRLPGRVKGEPAHDLLQHVVGEMGGEMLTRKLPIPPAEPGVVY